MASSSDIDRVMGRVSPQAYFSGRVSPPTSHVLTKAHILDAILRSKDDGRTLDLSNKNLIDVGEAGAEELAQVGRGDDLVDECCILRIALVGNNLSSLPMTFAHLSRLRYLNLRSNSFSVFPEVLTLMPSLEILDFSRNRIRGLPTNPGTLVNLRVMSISRNKIRKLPAYLCNFKALTVLKADHNPIEWPPKEVMEPEDDLEKQEVMHRWVGYLKDWISDNRVEDEKSHQLALGSSPQEEQVREEANQHSRSISIDSQSSVYSTSSFVALEENKPEKPPTIDTSNVSPSIADGFSASPDSYLPTPEDSLGSVDDDTARPIYNAHMRNESYTSATSPRSPNSSLTVQKSLPDLRMDVPPPAKNTRAFMRDLAKRASLENFSSPFADSSVHVFETPVRPRPSRSSRQSHDPLPSISEWRAPSMDEERNSYFRRLSTLPVATISYTTPKALLSVVDSVRGILFAVSQVYQSLQHYTVFCIDESLSSVLMKVLDPASSYMLRLINALDKFDVLSRRGCPPPTVCRQVIESCRDNVVMFGKAVSVLALQLKVLASRDDVRYSRQMLLVIYGAMAEISNSWQGIAPQLESIESLLREDRPSPTPSPGMSTPTPMKIAPTKSQLMQTSSSRSMSIHPIAEQPEPSSADSPPSFPRPIPVSRAHSEQQHIISTPPGQALPMSRPTQSEPRSRMNRRRHAGSFSVKDVEIGRSLPSNFDVSPPGAGLASGTSTPTPRRGGNMPPSGSIAPPLPSMPAMNGIPPSPNFQQHSRQSSVQNGSNMESSTASVGAPQLSLSGPSKAEAPTSSSALVDNHAIDSMANAVRAAPAVWAVLEEISGEMSGSPVNLHDNLMRAQDITRKLSENIRAIQDGHIQADRKALREDAHVFAKAVISLSKVVKDYAAQKLSGQLRADIAKLTNATQEFVMLLHVSSFAPSTPRPYSPMVSANASTGSISTGTSSNNGVNSSGNGTLPTAATSTTSSQSPAQNTSETGEERPLLGSGINGPSSLSRSRSAQPAPSSKLAPIINGASGTALPRSALPHQQGFKLPSGSLLPISNGTPMRTHGQGLYVNGAS